MVTIDRGEIVQKIKLTTRGKVVGLVLGAAMIVAGTVTATAAAKAAPAPPKPVGLYSNGQYVACVTNASPYTVKGHAGAQSKACPSGTRKLTLNVKGATGAKGSTGAKGATGATGAKGSTGAPGKDGVDGKDGTDAATPVYGTAQVLIARGSNAATVWATASTSVGSPDGDNASNTFRSTCSTANAPCTISVKAKATKAGVKLYPRLLIQKTDIDTGKPVGQCEYGDGTTNSGGTLTLSTTNEIVPLGIGGSLDCGSDQERPASGVVDEIKVPAGYYDLAFTAVFTAAD